MPGQARVRSLSPIPLLPGQQAPIRIMARPPRRRQQLDVYERTRITTLKSTGLSYRQIHEQLPHIPIATLKTTVQRERKRERNTTLPRPGRPRKLSDNDKERVIDLIEENPRVKCEDLLAEVDHKVCRMSIWRLLRESNKRKWRCLRRPELSPEIAEKRLAWALRWRYQTSEQWRRVFWSDESTVERGRGVRREWTFTRPKDQLREHDVDTYPHHGIKQMFWAAFSGSGRRSGLIPLYPEDETQRGVNRWVILETYSRVLPTLMTGVSDAIFMHDNAPVHTAHVVRDWLTEQEFDVMIWPPYSPDLNPIENLWALLKAKIHELHTYTIH